MSEMGKAVVKRVGDLDVVCRELTVGQLRGLLASDSVGEVVDDFLFRDMRLSDITVMTSLTADQVTDLHPSQLRDVVDGCREANPDFFGMVGRLNGAEKAL